MNRKAHKAEAFPLVTLSEIPGYFVTAESFTQEGHMHTDKRFTKYSSTVEMRGDEIICFHFWTGKTRQTYWTVGCRVFPVQKWKQRHKFWLSNCKELVRFRENISRPLHVPSWPLLLIIPCSSPLGTCFCDKFTLIWTQPPCTFIIPKKLYHYTDEKGAKAIRASGRIKASTITSTDALWRRFVRHSCDTWATFS